MVELDEVDELEEVPREGQMYDVLGEMAEMALARMTLERLEPKLAKWTMAAAQEDSRDGIDYIWRWQAWPNNIDGWDEVLLRMETPMFKLVEDTRDLTGDMLELRKRRRAEYVETVSR